MEGLHRHRQLVVYRDPSVCQISSRGGEALLRPTAYANDWCPSQSGKACTWGGSSQAMSMRVRVHDTSPRCPLSVTRGKCPLLDEDLQHALDQFPILPALRSQPSRCHRRPFHRSPEFLSQKPPGPMRIMHPVDWRAGANYRATLRTVVF